MINGIIYKLISGTTEKIYIGSTVGTLQTRLREHKKEYRRYLEKKIYYKLSSFEIIKNDDVKIEKICEYRCENLAELHKKEHEIISQTDCVNIRGKGRKCEKKSPKNSRNNPS